MSPGGGGGQGGVGPEAERGDVEGDVDALREQLDRAARLIKSLNEVSNGVRRGEVDPELLAALNLTEEPGVRGGDGEAFDRSKTENKELELLTRDRAGDREPPGAEGKDDPGEKIYETPETPHLVDSPTLKAGDLSPDEVRKLVESGRVDVSPEYRRLVERYFGQLSEDD
jgi:hypothetical protein